MVRIGVAVVVLLVLVETALSFLNTTLKELDDNEVPDTRRRQNSKKSKKYRSTSSSSGQKRSADSGDDDDSLDISSATDSSSGTDDKKYPKPKSSLERRGWRKWHRKCSKCPTDMKKKWRDPSIKWICGAYQRARRSFKSVCMMHYRNCQDGTMFVKISGRRCANTTGIEEPIRGDHFFYDYKAKLYEDSTDSKSSSEPSSKSGTSSFE